MQVQNISMPQNSRQSFQGKINIYSGNLSYNPARHVRKAYDAMEAIIKDKPIDLIIKQNNKTQSVSVIAKKSADIGIPDAPQTEVLIPKAAVLGDNYKPVGHSPEDIYTKAAKNAVEEYEQLFSNISFSDVIKKIGRKLFTFLRKTDKLS